MTPSNRGFSMLEVTIVVLVVSLAILPVFGIFSKIFSSTTLTIEEIQGTNIASELMDALHSLPYNVLPVVPEMTSVKEIPAPTGDLESFLKLSPVDEKFSRSVKIIEKSPALPEFEEESDIRGVRDRISRMNRFKIITVRVSWNDDGFRREATLRTIKTTGRKGELGFE